MQHCLAVGRRGPTASILSPETYNLPLRNLKLTAFEYNTAISIDVTIIQHNWSFPRSTCLAGSNLTVARPSWPWFHALQARPLAASH